MLDSSALSSDFFLSNPMRRSPSIVGKEPWLSMNFLREPIKKTLRHS